MDPIRFRSAAISTETHPVSSQQLNWCTDLPASSGWTAGWSERPAAPTTSPSGCLGRWSPARPRWGGNTSWQTWRGEPGTGIRGGTPGTACTWGLRTPGAGKTGRSGGLTSAYNLRPCMCVFLPSPELRRLFQPIWRDYLTLGMLRSPYHPTSAAERRVTWIQVSSGDLQVSRRVTWQTTDKMEEKPILPAFQKHKFKNKLGASLMKTWVSKPLCTTLSVMWPDRWSGIYSQWSCIIGSVYLYSCNTAGWRVAVRKYENQTTFYGHKTTHWTHYSDWE